MKDTNIFYRIKPFFITLAIIVVDQLSKLWVIKNIPVNTVYGSYFNDFLWIVHVRNTGAAFSMGDNLSKFPRIAIFIVLPILVMAAISHAILLPKKYLTRIQQFFAAGIVGGGIGTIIDRIVRFDEGVVDFISIKFYGLFGLDRWPTFNVSDSCVVVFVILFAITIFFTREETK